MNALYLIAITAGSIALIWVFVWIIAYAAKKAGLPSFVKMANVLGAVATIIVLIGGIVGAFSVGGPRLALDRTTAPAPTAIEPTGETPVLIEEVDRRGSWDRGSRLESERDN